jgi:hypothetical protein
LLAKFITLRAKPEAWPYCIIKINTLILPSPVAHLIPYTL